jgi:voltage-gated potassium channel
MAARVLHSGADGVIPERDAAPSSPPHSLRAMTGEGPVMIPRRIERLLTRRRIFLRLIVTTTTLVLLSGILISVLDRAEFPSVWLGMWWAVQTVTTVGYGDVVPTQVWGRIIAALVMLVGIGFLSLITATVASSLIARAGEGSAAAQREAVANAFRQIELRLDELERLLREERRES